jgi:hypothetical protein
VAVTTCWRIFPIKNQSITLIYPCARWASTRILTRGRILLAHFLLIKKSINKPKFSYQVGSYQNHHVGVAAVAISPDEDRLVSLGGQVCKFCNVVFYSLLLNLQLVNAQQFNATSFQCYNYSMLQLFNATTFQCHIYSMVQLFSATSFQCHIYSMLPQVNAKSSQCYI